MKVCALEGSTTGSAEDAVKKLPNPR